MNKRTTKQYSIDVENYINEIAQLFKASEKRKKYSQSEENNKLYKEIAEPICIKYDVSLKLVLNIHESE